MKLLIVEDEGPKLQNIKDLANELGLFDEIVEARSVGGAVRIIRAASYNLIILDMSLPTFDIAPGEGGGRPQGFGGLEVLRIMGRFQLTTPVIVVTAFEAFAEKGKAIDLKALEKTLRSEHPDTFKGVVLYNTMFSAWRESLRKEIRSAVLK